MMSFSSCRSSSWSLSWWMMFVVVTAMLTLTLLQSTEAFDVRRHSRHPNQQQPTTTTKTGSSSSSSGIRPSKLSYRNDKANTDHATTTGSIVIPSTPSLLLGEQEKEEDKHNMNLPYFLNDLKQQQQQLEKEEAGLLRERLKKELAIAAIEQYTSEEGEDQSSSLSAESIMKQLELVNPFERPASHTSLNARWSFVFTGVPTIGMRLITLLSRLSVGFPILDFRDVYLEIFNHSKVQATVSVDLFNNNFPFQLNVYTKLQQPTTTTDDDGTILLETFDKLVLNGIEIPTPTSWKSTRTLQISYLDEDFMIARTAGGEPHLLLRHSICQTHDLVDECDIDDLETTSTSYLKQARSKYGPTLTRSLVDREYYFHPQNNDSSNDENHVENMESIIRLIQSILDGKSSH